MLLQGGSVVDSVTGAPLAGATIALDSIPVGTTDNRGMFNINTLFSGTGITISYVGYNPVSYPVDQLSQLPQIPMTVSQAASALPPVVVTPSGVNTSAVSVASMPSSMYPLLIGGGALLLLSQTGKKKRVRGMNTNTLLIAGAAGVALLLLLRKQSTPVYTQPVYNPSQYPTYGIPATNQTAQDINAGGTAVSSILNAISNL